MTEQEFRRDLIREQFGQPVRQYKPPAPRVDRGDLRALLEELGDDQAEMTGEDVA